MVKDPDTKFDDLVNYDIIKPNDAWPDKEQFIDLIKSRDIKNRMTRQFLEKVYQSQEAQRRSDYTTIKDILTRTDILTRDDIKELAKSRNIPEDRILNNEQVRRELRRDMHVQARRDRFRNLEREDPTFLSNLIRRKQDKVKFLKEFYNLGQDEAEQAVDRLEQQEQT